MAQEKELKGWKLKTLLLINFVLTVVFAVWMLALLNKAEEKYLAQEKAKQKIEASAQARQQVLQRHATLTDAQKDSLAKKEAQNPHNQPEPGAKEEIPDGVTFYEILLMMLLAGSLGGVLCNLRGFFMHYRGDEKYFPVHLQVPYYTRAFLGGGAGLFIYFVASFMITSVTMEYSASKVPFPGMVSFIALSMLAGFGSLEFFQRLKETALALFGQKAEKDKWQRIEDLYALWKKEVLTKEEFDVLKTKLLNEAEITELYKKGKDAEEKKIV